MKKLFILVLAAILCVSSVSCVDFSLTTPQSSAAPTYRPGGEETTTPGGQISTLIDPTEEFSEGTSLLTVNYLNVGQGDSIFIVLPDGKTLLIDASVSNQSGKIISFIEKNGFDSIDYVVATHPHADHIGGMTAVLEAFDIGVMYMPEVTTNTKTFEKMLDKIEEKEIVLKRARAGVTICEGSDFSVKILAPNRDEYGDLNDYSAVLKIEYGNRSFMFMGDAHIESEEEITADVSCDVVKVGHHGSSTSSGENFVKKTGAKYAIFSLGEGNDYGHPHIEAVQRWQSIGASILRTDLLGDIVVVTDGDKMVVCAKGDSVTDNLPTSQPETTVDPDFDNSDAEVKCTWILNTNSKIIHCQDCSSVKMMSEKNKKQSDESIDALIAQGYSCCKICKPESEV